LCTVIAGLSLIFVGCTDSSRHSESAGTSDRRSSAGSTAGEASGVRGGREFSAGATPTDTGSREPTQLVSLTGCLQGGASAAAETPTGRRRSPTGGAAERDDNFRTDRFVLTNAKPSAPDPAADRARGTGGSDNSGASGAGTNGAGGSGGPLVSGVSSYLLEGGAELRSHLNQQVRITGRLDPQESALEGSNRRAGDSALPNARATSDPSGPGAVSPNGAGQGRDERSSAEARRLVVDTVQTLASSCTRE
jgi:hypothetical protein